MLVRSSPQGASTFQRQWRGRGKWCGTTPSPTRASTIDVEYSCRASAKCPASTGHANKRRGFSKGLEAVQGKSSCGSRVPYTTPLFATLHLRLVVQKPTDPLVLRAQMGPISSKRLPNIHGHALVYKAPRAIRPAGTYFSVITWGILDIDINIEIFIFTHCCKAM